MKSIMSELRLNDAYFTKIFWNQWIKFLLNHNIKEWPFYLLHIKYSEKWN